MVAFAHHLYDFTWTTGNDGRPVLPPDDADAGSRSEDPSAAPVESGDSALGYLMFAGGNRSGYNWRAGLADGVTVTGWEEIQETCGGFDSLGAAVDPIILCNAVDAPDTSLHLTWIAAAGGDLDRYIISIPNPLVGITSGTYDTGGCNTILKQDPDLSYEHNGIREAAVARFRGCWVMVYVTGIAPTASTMI